MLLSRRNLISGLLAASLTAKTAKATQPLIHGEPVAKGTSDIVTIYFNTFGSYGVFTTDKIRIKTKYFFGIEKLNHFQYQLIFPNNNIKQEYLSMLQIGIEEPYKSNFIKDFENYGGRYTRTNNEFFKMDGQFLLDGAFLPTRIYGLTKGLSNV